MEDSFNVRVSKIFGSLSSSSSSSSSSSAPASSSSSSLSSMWCLTDSEIERQKWNREKPIPEPHKDLLEDEYADGIEYEGEEEEEEEEEEDEEKVAEESEPKNEDSDWDIKASIGRDCTLDFEDEEDEFDRLAVGNDKGDKEGVFVRAVEDETENPKSILKRKNDENPSDSKSGKRVRFDPDTLDNHPQNDTRTQTQTKQSGAGVPDYVMNPSRYTRYTLDTSSDMNGDDNKQAYADLLSVLKKASEESEEPSEKPVTFIPRKKKSNVDEDSDASMVDTCAEMVQQVGIGNAPIAAAAAVEETGEASAMEEDQEPKAAAAVTQKPKSGRQYRVKTRQEGED